MNKGRISIYFIISLIIIGFTLLTYGEAVENTVMGLINAGTMPEKYYSCEGWFFNYAPVEHFMIISLVFTLFYYFVCLLNHKRDLVQKILIGGVQLSIYLYINRVLANGWYNICAYASDYWTCSSL